jgi:predicted PurR-regulated permease PerM
VLTLDDRTGNVLTTVAAFAAVVAIAYVARATLLAFVLALLLAYLLEPLVAGMERLVPKGAHARAVSIAIIYIGATVLAAGAAYSVAPAAVDDFRRLGASLPALAERLDALAPAGRGDMTPRVADRVTHTIVPAAKQAAWLLLVPVVAVFFLDNRAVLLDGAVGLVTKRSDCERAKRTIHRIDHALGEYTRGQLALAGLSAGFYVISMALLGVPYALALSIAGGALEFVPIVGWMIAAAAILASAWSAHAHWIWMAVLILVWRLVQNFINSPRLLGNRLQMPPLTVLFALMVGTQIGGLAGAILSVPAVAVFRIVRLED